MPVFGSGNHHGSLSRQIYAKKRTAVRKGEIQETIEYGTLEQALQALEEI